MKRFLFVFTLAAIVLLTSCTNRQSRPARQLPAAKPTAAPVSVGTPPDRAPLFAALHEMKDHWYRSMSPSVVEKYEKGFEKLRESTLRESVLKEGDTAVAFTLHDTRGAMVSLDSLRRRGPVVIVWYQGGWSPFCNATLKEMQHYLAFFKKEGATMIGISPETPAHGMKTAEQDSVTFPLLYDKGNAVARKYRLVYKIPKPMLEEINKHHILEAYNGDRSYELPMTMAYIVDTNGVVRYAFGDPDYTIRAEPREIADALDRFRVGK